MGTAVGNWFGVTGDPSESNPLWQEENRLQVSLEGEWGVVGAGVGQCELMGEERCYMKSVVCVV